MWYKLAKKYIYSGKKEVLEILGDSPELLNAVQSVTSEPKLQTIAAYFLKKNINPQQLQQVLSQLQEVLQRKPYPVFANSDGVMLNNETFTNWLRFTERAHSYYSLLRPSNYQQQEIQSKPNEFGTISVVKIHNVAEAIHYGEGESWCISQPRNTMWQSYRDSQVSTFYFVTDNKRQPDDPLSHVVVDATSNGILLTDRSNNTGTISEFGSDVNAYLQYLQSNGIDISQFKNDPLTEEEIKENKLLGNANNDLQWFMDLSYDYKSKYIGRGHVLSDEQFRYLLNNNAQDLINQYINAVSITLPDSQVSLLNTQQYKKYMRICIITVQQNEYALANAPEGARNNSQIVMEAVKKDGASILYASKELQNNPQIVMEAVKQRGNALQYASKELQNNPQIVMEAVKRSGETLNYASYKLQSNPSIVMVAVKQNGNALLFASKELQNNPQIVMEAVKQRGNALQYASKELQNNPQIVMEAVKQSGTSILFASKELQNNPQIAMVAVRQDGNALYYVSEELRNNPQIAIEAVKQNKLHVVPVELLNNPQFMEQVRKLTA